MNGDVENQFDHGPILARLRDRSLIPFLGAAASFVGAGKDGRLPDGARFASELLEGIRYPGAANDSLTKTAQYIEEGPGDRQYLLAKVEHRFDEKVAVEYRTSFTDFLETIPETVLPPLIITTNYDVLVERSLERRGIPYLAMSQVLRGSRYAGRWICYSALAQPLSENCILPLKDLEELLKEERTAGDRDPRKRVVWIYKIHGTARVKLGKDLLDSVVLTEGDYIEFLARDILRSIPGQVSAILRKNSLLFLGYALEDWNFRVLLQRIRALQLKSNDLVPRHWAFLLDANPVEEQFWRLRGVNLYNASLHVCLETLSAALKQGEA